MNKLIITLTLLTTSAILAGCNGGGSDPTAQQQLQQTQQQLMQQQASTGSWQLAAGVLAITCIVLFLIGTAIGSKARRNGKETDHCE